MDFKRQTIPCILHCNKAFGTARYIYLNLRHIEQISTYFKANLFMQSLDHLGPKLMSDLWTSRYYLFKFSKRQTLLHCKKTFGTARYVYLNLRHIGQISTYFKANLFI